MAIKTKIYNKKKIKKEIIQLISISKSNTAFIRKDNLEKFQEKISAMSCLQ